ncbi:MAG: glycosyltransferase family 4 protein [Phormidesmis sp.]
MSRPNRALSTNIRIAWVSPTMSLGFYIQPVLRELGKLFPDTKIFTAVWPGFVPGCEDTFPVEIVGERREILLRKTRTGYDRTLQVLSTQIIPKLIAFRPELIFVTGFSLWTVLILLLKPLWQWKTVLIYSGSSPNTDMTDSRFRLRMRQWVAQRMNGFITNSQAGKAYLTQDLGVRPERVFARPYQIPDKQALLAKNTVVKPGTVSDSKVCLQASAAQKPITFLYIGQVINRKGIDALLKACADINERGYEGFRLIVIGDGEQREELEGWVSQKGLESQIQFVGWKTYGELGSYFQSVDVFVFPTLEDIWGMVVLEAMLFGKPILCSKQAGALEMIVEGENGYLFDPYNIEELSKLMIQFLKDPELIGCMGQQSEALIAEYTPAAAAAFFKQVATAVSS